MKIKNLIRKATGRRHQLCTIKQGCYKSDINEMTLTGLYAFSKAEGYRYEINDGRITRIIKEKDRLF